MVASRSAASFRRWPECPFTQTNSTSPRALTSSMNGSHRSRFLTGSFFEFFQSFLSHPFHHSCRKQLTTYVESLCTRNGPSKACTAALAAVSSIRWLVVWASNPDDHSPSSTTNAQPPGPGLPRHAPSVNTSVTIAVLPSSLQYRKHALRTKHAR